MGGGVQSHFRVKPYFIGVDVGVVTINTRFELHVNYFDTKYRISACFGCELYILGFLETKHFYLPQYTIYA